MKDALSNAIQEVERKHPLPRCVHGKALRDGAGEELQPPCGCRATPPPDTKVQSETLEEIADRLVDEHDCHCCVTAEALTASYAKLRADVLSALRNERERAIRIINDHQAMDVCNDNCWTTIKAAIRNGR